MIAKKHLALIIVLLIFYVPAKSTAHAAGWTPFTQVNEVYTYSSGYIFVTLPSSAHINPDACPVATPYRIEASAVNNDKMYQMLLTAKASGKKVSAYLGGCGGSYPKILHLRLRD